MGLNGALLPKRKYRPVLGSSFALDVLRLCLLLLDKVQLIKTSFYYDINEKKDKKHDRIIFDLSNNQKLIYNDIRKFGFIKLYAKSEYSEISHLKKLGPEPLKNEFNFNYKKQMFGCWDSVP